jgi:hypothetical protein
MTRLALLLCLLLAIAAEPVSADYVWTLGCCDQTGGSPGSQVRTGYKAVPGSTTAQDWSDTYAAHCGFLMYTAGLDSTMVKTGLDRTHYVGPTDPRKYLFNVWCGPDWSTQYQGSEFSVRVWASSTANTPPTGFRLYKLYDPISDTWDRTELTADSIPTTLAGANLSMPWFKCALPVYRTADPLQYRGGYVLELSVPEPSAMSALLCSIGWLAVCIGRRRA